MSSLSQWASACHCVLSLPWVWSICVRWNPGRRLRGRLSWFSWAARLLWSTQSPGLHVALSSCWFDSSPAVWRTHQYQRYHPRQSLRWKLWNSIFCSSPNGSSLYSISWCFYGQAYRNSCFGYCLVFLRWHQDFQIHLRHPDRAPFLRLLDFQREWGWLSIHQMWMSLVLELFVLFWTWTPVATSLPPLSSCLGHHGSEWKPHFWISDVSSTSSQ